MYYKLDADFLRHIDTIYLYQSTVHVVKFLCPWSSNVVKGITVTFTRLCHTLIVTDKYCNEEVDCNNTNLQVRSPPG